MPTCGCSGQLRSEVWPGGDELPAREVDRERRLLARPAILGTRRRIRLVRIRVHHFSRDRRLEMHVMAAPMDEDLHVVHVDCLPAGKHGRESRSASRCPFITRPALNGELDRAGRTHGEAIRRRARIVKRHPGRHQKCIPTRLFGRQAHLGRNATDVRSPMPSSSLPAASALASRLALYADCGLATPSRDEPRPR